MTSRQDTPRHTCHYCETEVLTLKGAKQWGIPPEPWRAWRLPLKHNAHEVRDAARSGCPLFVLVWKFMDCLLSEEGLKEVLDHTEIDWEFEVVKLEQTPTVDPRSTHDSLMPTHHPASREHYDITACTILSYSPCHDGGKTWDQRFTAVSDWGMVFLLFNIYIRKDCEVVSSTACIFTTTILDEAYLTAICSNQIFR